MYNIQQPQSNGMVKGKRPNSISVSNLQDPEFLNIVRKKVKSESSAETEVKTPENSNTRGESIKIPEQSTPPHPIGFQSCNLNSAEKKDLLNNIILNNFLNPTTPPSKLENSNSNILIPFLQNGSQSQTPNGSSHTPNMLQNGMSQIALAQFLTNFKVKQPMGVPTNTTTNTTTVIQNNTETNTSFTNVASKPKPMDATSLASQANYDNLMRDFQSKILGLLVTQNKMLIDLKEKNEMLQDTLACLINEINSLKSTVKTTTVLPEKPPTQSSSNPLYIHQIIGNSTDTVTTENLLTYLYGPTPDFQYHIILKSELSLPLYRERNFKFTVVLVDKNGNPVENSNRIPLTIGIYSSENPPKYIDANTSGNKILKGFIEKDMVNGTATFEKIQIKEVTSHFRNGWVFFVVYPKVVAVGSNTILLNGHNIVNAAKVKPLILEKVVVKAKKSKERDNLNESGEIYNEDVESVTNKMEDEKNTVSKEEIVYTN
jgi:hypothetical protein